MRDSLTWKHEREGVRESRVVLGDSLTWKHERKGVRKSGLKRGVVLGERFIYMEI